MIDALASIKAPGRFGRMVMVGPSPRYIDDLGYRGGLTTDTTTEFWHECVGIIVISAAARPMVNLYAILASPSRN